MPGWLELIQNVGIIGTMLLLVLHWTSRRVEKTEENAIVRETAMGNRIEKLSDTITNELSNVIKDQGRIIAGAEKAIEHNEAVLHQCMGILGKLDSSILKNTSIRQQQHDESSGIH